MERKKMLIRFRRPLNFEERTRLISHFKGMVVSNKKAFGELFKATWVVHKIGNAIGYRAMDALKIRIEAMLAEKKLATGATTSEFEENFVLNFDEKKPTEYEFEFLGLISILGHQEIIDKLKKTGIDIDYSNKQIVRRPIKNAKLYDLVESITPIYTVSP